MAIRESTAQLAAREAGEREAAIDGSIDAMSPADIRRFINPAGMDETGYIARRSAVVRASSSRATCTRSTTTASASSSARK